MLAREAAAKDFVSDAFAHAKFMAYAATAQPLFEKAWVTEPDGGCIALKGAGGREGIRRGPPQAALLGSARPKVTR